ncbi:MAG: cell division protein [Ignavibacteriales bacterium CG12_big_fil_rev_8_21_14_0_65_30_8]|nr:MAG: cell division protein [Ignavibacteriales bacterium CG12_big_fil_rev_8_21_14_0_65_30_8]
MKKLALTIFFETFILVLLGLVMVMTASGTYSVHKFSNVFYLFNSHFGKVIFGLIALIVFSFIPYEAYKEYSKPALILVTLFLIFILLFGNSVKGADRWVSIFGSTFQPAEIAKLILIIHLAKLIEDKGEIIKDFWNGFFYLFFWVILISVLIMLEPNISNGMLLIFISLVILFVGGAKLTHIISTSFITMFSALSVAMLFSHSRERILSFINSVQHGGDLNFQVKQALYGLGSGGLTGVGIGHSNQSNLFLPESYGDFIFAILGEETGFIGAVIVLLAFLFLFIAGLYISKKAKDKFGQMLGFGISFSILTYALVNASVAIGLIPTTGLPLPFISYGGTSMILMCMSVGILVNIAVTNSISNKENDFIEQPIILDED